MNKIMQILVLAFVVEALWETLKMVWKDGAFSVNKVGALVIGVIACVNFNIDVFEQVGIDGLNKMVNLVLSGVLVSRGGNFVHDLFGKLGVDTSELVIKEEKTSSDNQGNVVVKENITVEEKVDLKEIKEEKKEEDFLSSEINSIESDIFK